MATVRYSFPTLKNAQILELMPDLGVPFTMDELKNPSEAKMWQLFETLSLSLMGVSREDTRQPQFGAMDQLAFPELHEDSLAQFAMIRTILRLLNAVGIHDASLRDITNPTYQRLKKILSALINFAKFREEQLSVYQAFSAQTDELLLQKDQAQQKNAQLEEEVAGLRRRRDAEMPEIKQIMDENESIEQKLAELNSLRAQKQEQAKDVKAKLAAAQDTVASKRFLLLNAKATNDKLRSQVVTDPGQLQQHLEELSIVVEELKGEVESLTNKKAELTGRHEALDTVHKKVSKRTDQVSAIQDGIQKHKQVLKQVKEATSKCAQHEATIKDLQAQELDLKKKVSQGMDRKFRLERQYEQKRGAAEIAVSQVRSELQVLRRQQARDEQDIEANRVLAETRKKELSEHKTKHEAEVDQLRSKCHMLTGVVKHYHSVVVAAMSEPLQ